jgi:hypothetical protein
MTPGTDRDALSGNDLQIALAEYELLRAARAQAQEGSAKRYDAHLVVLGFAGVALSVLVGRRVSTEALRAAVTTAGVAALLLGVVTFNRLIEFTITSTTYTRALNALRRLLVAGRPQLERAFVLPTDERVPSMLGVGFRSDWPVLLFNRAGAVGALNAAVAGAVCGMWLSIAADKFLRHTWALTTGVSGAFVVAVVVAWWHVGRQRERLDAAELEYWRNRADDR